MIPDEYGQYRGGPPGDEPPRGGPPRDEKQDEKEREKRQEKGGGLDEKYHRNPPSFVAWALVIIWLGVTLLLQRTDVLADDDQGWAVFLWGAGIIFLAETLLCMTVPRWRRSLRGTFILGVILIVVGFGLYYDEWEIVGPAVIIAVGVAILVGRFLPRR